MADLDELFERSRRLRVEYEEAVQQARRVMKRTHELLPEQAEIIRRLDRDQIE